MRRDILGHARTEGVSHKALTLPDQATFASEKALRILGESARDVGRSHESLATQIRAV